MASRALPSSGTAASIHFPNRIACFRNAQTAPQLQHTRLEDYRSSRSTKSASPIWKPQARISFPCGLLQPRSQIPSARIGRLDAGAGLRYGSLWFALPLEATLAGTSPCSSSPSASRLRPSPAPPRGSFGVCPLPSAGPRSGAKERRARIARSSFAAVSAPAQAPLRGDPRSPPAQRPPGSPRALPGYRPAELRVAGTLAERSTKPPGSPRKAQRRVRRGASRSSERPSARWSPGYGRLRLPRPSLRRLPCARPSTGGGGRGGREGGPACARGEVPG